MKRIIILTTACMCLAVGANIQRGSGRLLPSAGLLYKNGLDVTLAYEHKMNYRHVWEFFADDYLQWAERESCKRVCPGSFWQNYCTYDFDVTYKPCVTKGCNHYGNPRIGASDGSDTGKLFVGLHFGYKHNYVLRAGWMLYWRIKEDVMIKGADILCAGVTFGVKLPIK